MFHQPRTLDEALRALAATNAQILAGGTDVFPALGDQPQRQPFLDISSLPELRGITRTAAGIRIGAGTTWAEITRADLPCGFKALKAAAREIGSIQIQNRATVGGNICNASPAADGVPPLLAMDALVELSGCSGQRTVPLERFLIGNRRTALQPGEIVSGILVPDKMNDARSVFLKLGARRYLVISIVMVAAMLRIGKDGCVEAASVAVGSCSAVAQRLPLLEASLEGQRAKPGLGAVVHHEHLAPLAPIDDVRATAGYRSDAARTLVARALEACLEDM